MKKTALFDTPAPIQARGRFQEAATEVRALLDLLRENMAAVQDTQVPFQKNLSMATVRLAILHPVHGDKELTRLVNVELDKLRRG